MSVPQELPAPASHQRTQPRPWRCRRGRFGGQCPRWYRLVPEPCRGDRRRDESAAAEAGSFGCRDRPRPPRRGGRAAAARRHAWPGGCPRAPAASHTAGSARRAARRASASAAYGSPDSSGTARPSSACPPRRRHDRNNSRHSRVLPIPASPETSTTLPAPSSARANRAPSCRGSAPRPTNAVPIGSGRTGRRHHAHRSPRPEPRVHRNSSKTGAPAWSAT